MTNKQTVSALTIFPVRSCAGLARQEAMVTPHGLIGDRQWRIVSAEGKFLTQPQCPRMALVQPDFEGSQLRMKLVGSREVSAFANEHTLSNRVHISDTCEGVDQGDEVARWLGTVLGIEARLLRVTDASAQADFARPNMSPVLVISEESLADLNSRLAESVRMNRFRPNIVVRGGLAYGEESWSRVFIGDVEFVASTEPCGRCALINIDQEKGERAGKEPLKTLASYRRTADGIIFGKYMVPLSAGVIRVNDTIKVA